MPAHFPTMIDKDTAVGALRSSALRVVDRPAGARTDQPSESTRRRWARLATAEAAAREAAHADGVREGYRLGWRWGLACGAIGSALVVGIAWSGWLWVHAPSATPVASARPL